MQDILPGTQFSHLKPFKNLLQINSTRAGGFSAAPYHFLNLGIHSADDLRVVRRNRTHFFKKLSIPENRLVFPEQVHSDRVEFVYEPGKVPRCDALVTDVPNLFLTIQTADCFSLFLFDPVAQAVAIVHSGWRGTARNIVGKTITVMVDECGSRPENILAGIGPGIQQSCYQVDDQTASNFDHAYLIPDGPGHFKLDVQGNILDQLLESGIERDKTQLDRTCTHCTEDLYYSYRRDGSQSGRMMGVIGIHNKS